MRTELGGAVAIIGTGTIKFGENFHQSLTDMIYEADDQLVARAGKMQVPGADMGLAHNLGGPGSVSAVAVLSQP